MNRPTIYLHVGFHKTGTTSIQQFLVDNEKRFAEHDCLVPVTGRDGHPHALLANCLKKTNIQLPTDELYADLAKEIAGSGKKKVIISSECFMESIPPERVRQQFEQIDADVKVIIYVRRQDSWLQSLYNEVVRDPSRRYTGDIMHMREVRNNVADYSAELSKWESAFDRRNVIVRVFEREQMPNGLFADFMAAVGLQLRDDFTEPDPKTSGNAGFPDVLVLALRSLNQIPMKRDMYGRLVATLTEFARTLHDGNKRHGNYALMSPLDQRHIIELYADGNRRIARELLSREDGRLFYAPLPKGDGAWQKPRMPDAEMQYRIFERLPEDIQKHFRRIHPRFKNIVKGESFFPLRATSEENRLRSVIRRMRLELNWLYEEKNKSQ